MRLGGFNISSELLDWMKFNLSGTLLELGSGEGTKELVKHFDKVYSVEDNPEYQNLYHDNYINIPLKGLWYDVTKLQRVLENIKYDCILVDAPSGSAKRLGFLHNIGLFNMKVPVIIDDTHREKEAAMFRRLQRMYKNKRAIHIESEDKKASILW